MIDMIQKITGSLAVLSILACSGPQPAKEIDQATETVKQLKMEIMTNKEKAAAINVAVQAADFNAITQLVREDYIQHTPLIADGRKGLQDLLTKIAYKEIPAPQIKNVRVFEDGDIVVLHHDVNWPTRKAMIEIFRFKDGLAAEHWSGISDHPEKTANGHSMVDGDTIVTDRGNTQQNKALVRSFVETVLIRGEFDKVRDFYHPDIIQHNPFIPDGVDGLIKGIQEFQSKGITIAIKKIHHVWGEGNFVLVVSEGTLAGKPTAFFDLFRTESGKVKEHWDVLQEIPAKQAHGNTMF
jgi:predicted SnoaL-like aldol condensation-catalyzing enzyme